MLDHLSFLLQEQIHDDALWFPFPEGSRECKLQEALRLMHAAVEEYVFKEGDAINKLLLVRKGFYVDGVGKTES